VGYLGRKGVRNYLLAGGEKCGDARKRSKPPPRSLKEIIGTEVVGSHNLSDTRKITDGRGV